MIEALQRWFSVDTILPSKDRLGPVETTKNLYNKYLKITVSGEKLIMLL